MAMSIAFGGPPPSLTLPHKGGGDGNSGIRSSLFASDIARRLTFLSPPPLWGRVREGVATVSSSTESTPHD
jgi:hypothetical protein